MKAFEYAAPREEAEVVGLLASRWGSTEILAGGTDLLGLMKKMIVTPDRVMNIKEVESLRGVSADSQGVVMHKIPESVIFPKRPMGALPVTPSHASSATSVLTGSSTSADSTGAR